MSKRVGTLDFLEENLTKKSKTDDEIYNKAKEITKLINNFEYEALMEMESYDNLYQVIRKMDAKVLDKFINYVIKNNIQLDAKVVISLLRDSRLRSRYFFEYIMNLKDPNIFFEAAKNKQEVLLNEFFTNYNFVSTILNQHNFTIFLNILNENNLIHLIDNMFISIVSELELDKSENNYILKKFLEKIKFSDYLVNRFAISSILNKEWNIVDFIIKSRLLNNNGKMALLTIITNTNPNERDNKEPSYEHIKFLNEYLLTGIMNENENFLNNIFIKACKNGYIDVVEALLQYGNINPSINNNQALIEAIKNGNFGVVVLLLGDGIDPSINDNEAIITAVLKGKSHIITLLMGDKRVDPSARDNQCIITAILNNDKRSVQALMVDSRVDPLVNGGHYIDYAIQHNFYNVIDELIQYENVADYIVNKMKLSSLEYY